MFNFPYQSSAANHCRALSPAASKYDAVQIQRKHSHNFDDYVCRTWDRETRRRRRRRRFGMPPHKAVGCARPLQIWRIYAKYAAVWREHERSDTLGRGTRCVPKSAWELHLNRLRRGWLEESYTLAKICVCAIVLTCFENVTFYIILCKVVLSLIQMYHNQDNQKYAISYLFVRQNNDNFFLKIISISFIVIQRSVV